MPKRISPEDRVTDYFMSANLDDAARMFNNVKRILFNRQYGMGATAVPTVKPKVTRKRKPKAEVPPDAA